MILQRSLFGSAFRGGICRQASHFYGSESSRSFHVFSQIPQNTNTFSVLRDTGMKLGLVTRMDYVFPSLSKSFSSATRLGMQTEAEGGRPYRSMDYIQGLLQERGNEMTERRSLHQPQVESNADIVHIKLMRNNAFVTVTDAKGNKKLGISAGKLAGRGGNLTRYYGDAAAEDIGRKVRQMKTKSVVVKVNGFTFFKRKKDAILSFRDGYSHSRLNVNPIMYIEDTTRKPHNGCRLPKRRRI